MRDGVILAVGTTAELAPLAGHAAVIIEAAGCVVTPGLVNTHHHLYQTLTRALPGATEASLFGWLKRLYPVWATVHARRCLCSDAIGAGGAGAFGLLAEQRPP